MATFESLPRAEQEKLCDAWLEAAPELAGTRAAKLRIYLHQWSLSDRVGDSAAPGSRELRYECAPQEVRVLSDGPAGSLARKVTPDPRRAGGRASPRRKQGRFVDRRGAVAGRALPGRSGRSLVNRVRAHGRPLQAARPTCRSIRRSTEAFS